MVQQPPTGNDCKYNQYYLLKLSTRYKQNDMVIINPKITRKT